MDIKYTNTIKKLPTHFFFQQIIHKLERAQLSEQWRNFTHTLQPTPQYTPLLSSQRKHWVKAACTKLFRLQQDAWRTWATLPQTKRYRKYWNIAHTDLNMRKQYLQQAPYLRAISQAQLATMLLEIRCQISSIPAHNPTKIRDPRRMNTKIYGSLPMTQHTPYELRYCRLCVPDPELWGPFTVPGVGTPIGNEDHLLLYCTALTQMRQNLHHDMQEFLTNFGHKYTNSRIPSQWTSIPTETQLSLMLGSVPPPTWELSFLKAHKWIYFIANAIESGLTDIFTLHTQNNKIMNERYSQ